MTHKERVNILLVDDQPSKLLSLEAILADMDENVIKASNADEALKHLLSHDIAVVLVDVCMPGMDGFELAEMIRGHPRHKRTAIIFISAVFLTDADRLKGYDLGAVDYIPVPIIPEVLRAKVAIFADLFRKTDQLERLNRELESRVQQRTADLDASWARLRDSEQRFRLMADSAPTLVWLAGTDKRCNWFNKPWLAFTGRAMEQEIGDGWAAGVHPEDLPRCLDIFTSSFDERREFKMEYRLRRYDGQYRWILDHGIPLYSGAEFTGYIGSCIDVTDQVIARHSMERQQSLLEEAVKARTEELAQSNARLRVSERMATIGTLAAGLGHDMGNLLLPVRLRLDSIEREPMPEQIREDIGAIRTAAEYLQRLAGSLRLLTIDPQGEAVDDAATELAGWWLDAEAMLRNALPRSVTLVGDFDASLPRLRIGKASLTQIIFNLVQNAGTALDGHTDGRVTISSRPGPAGQARVFVEDNGPGMSEEVRSRCLEPFFTTKTRAMSTGLGLALVNGLVQRCGGGIKVHSTPGLGTRVELLVPVAASSVSLCADPPGKRDIALVSVRDQRIGAHVRSALELMAFDVRCDAAPMDAAVWVIDSPDHRQMSDLRRFIAEHDSRRGVVLGEVKGSDADDPRLVVIEPPIKPSTLLKRLSGVLRPEPAIAGSRP